MIEAIEEEEIIQGHLPVQEAEKHLNQVQESMTDHHTLKRITHLLMA
jgi:hypothetical protein